MTVIRPNSISGITSLTAHRGSIDFYAHDGSAARFDNINSNVTSGVSTFASLNITGDLDVGGALTYEDVTNVDSIGVITARNGIDVTGGNVDIGGATHSRNLSVHDATNSVILIEGASNGTSNLMFADENDEDVGMLGYNHASNYLAVTVNAAERLRITSAGTLESYSPDDTTPNIKWRSNDTNWYGSLNQSVEGGTITSFLSCGGDWSANGTTYSATKALAAYPTSAIAVHNQYNSTWGSEFVFLTKAGGSTTTDGAVTERLRITSAGQVKVGGNTLVSPNGNADNFVIDTGDVDSGLSILSATTGRIYFGDAADSAAGSIRYVHTDNSMRFEAAGGERLRITDGGMVGINMTPSASGNSTYMLQMYNAGSQCFMSIGQGSGNGPLNGLVMGVSNAGHYITGRENQPMIFATNDTERLRIQSHGTSTFQPTMGLGARNIRIWANTAGSKWRSFIGTNLDWDGSNFYKNSDNGGNNWGNVAGITFDGGNVGNEVAIRFLTDLPSGSSNFPNNLGSAESVITSRTAGYFDTAGRLHLDNQPCAMAYNAQGQHMSGNAVAQFNSTRFNIGNMYNSSNGRMTVPVAGRYLVAYSGLHDYDSSSAIGFEFRINGSAFDGGEGYQNRSGTPISSSQLSKTLILSLSANDYVEIFIRETGSKVHQRYGSFSVSLLT